MQRRDLEQQTREELIAHAEQLGVVRPRVLTHAELIEEILTRSPQGEGEPPRPRGFLSRARDLLARVVERGLHLPEAARLLRGSPATSKWPSPPPPLPTVTLAEIYAAQGHLERAIGVLNQVLAREPNHEDARKLLERFSEQLQRRGKKSGQPTTTQQEQPPTTAPSSPPSEQPPNEASEQPPNEASEQPPNEASLQPPVSEEPSEPASAPQLAASSDEGVPEAIDASEPDAIQHVSDVEPPAESAQADLSKQPPDVQAADEKESPWPEQHELPAHYHIDEIVGMAVDPHTLYVYWEVRPTTLALAQSRHPEGRMVIRLVAVLPTWNGPDVAQHEVKIDALSGDRFVRGIGSGSDVRMSIGWSFGTVFEPFAVGLEVTLPGDLSEAATLQPQVTQKMAALREQRGRTLPTETVTTPSHQVQPPQRFPAGSIPTPAEISRAVARTRVAVGGASDLSRPPGGASDLWRPRGFSLTR